MSPVWNGKRTCSPGRQRGIARPCVRLETHARTADVEPAPAAGVPNRAHPHVRRSRLALFFVIPWIDQIQREKPAPDLISETGKEAGRDATQPSG